MNNLTENEALIISVRIIPRASKSEIIGNFDGSLKIKIVSPPVNGAANSELIKTLAAFFEVPKSVVEIIKGQTSRIKLVKITGSTAANLLDLKSA